MKICCAAGAGAWQWVVTQAEFANDDSICETRVLCARQHTVGAAVRTCSFSTAPAVSLPYSLFCNGRPDPSFLDFVPWFLLYCNSIFFLAFSFLLQEFEGSAQRNTLACGGVSCFDNPYPLIRGGAQKALWSKRLRTMHPLSLRVWSNKERRVGTSREFSKWLGNGN